MRRLDGASALMIYGDEPRCYQHTLKIAILDYSESPDLFNASEIIEDLRENVEIMPFLKWRIGRVPFGVHHPVWIQDLEFDISHHVKHIACPAPGDRRAFCQLVSELYAQNLSTSKPLWTLWIVEGLENDRVALVNMLHHAYTDGVGASIMLKKLAAFPRPPATSSESFGVNSNKNPSSARLFAQGVLELPLTFARKLPSLVKDWRMLQRLKRSGLEMPPSTSSSPASPMLNAPYAHGRTFCYESLPLAEFKEVGKYFDATINDLLLAVIAGAIRSYYQESGWPTPEEPLVASVPINVRGEADRDVILGNHVTNSAVHVPIHLDDAIECLEAVKESARIMKNYVEASRGLSIMSAIDLLPPFFATAVNWIFRTSGGRITPFGNFAISNVPGPREPIRSRQNVRVSDWLSIGQVTMGVGLNITAWSYVDHLNVCLMANKATIGEGERFLENITASFDEYRRIREGLQREGAVDNAP